MGVRGLTSYIARRAELYLQPFQLHDCNLVIDGDSLACNLYRDASGTCSAFGGDYDDFYRFVVHFFSILAECKVKAFVLMDGGYQKRKLRTVRRRLLGKIAVIKRINPCGSVTIFPLMIKEVFLDAVRDCGVPVMRCIFEADDELAALARKLNCPVLSYDSDFYVHNVSYIPLVTLTLKVNLTYYNLNVNLYKQTETASSNRKNHQNFKCKKKNEKTSILVQADCKTKSYKYLDCSIYRMETLLRHFGLSRDKMPVLAAMLGNDYISCSAFNKFFETSMGNIGLSRKTNKHQNRIKRTILWLRNETAETAVEKILSRLPLEKRLSIKARITDAMSGYKNEKCTSFDFFRKNYLSAIASITLDQKTIDAPYDTIEEISEKESERISSNGSEDKFTGVEAENDINCNESFLVADSSGSDSFDMSKQNEMDYSKGNNLLQVFPAWFLDKLYFAQIPRYFVDLFYLHKYINNPQIEHFPYKDCNEIALPILIYIYTLLHNAKPQTITDKSQMKENRCANKTTSLTYLTRIAKFANIGSIHYAMQSLPKYDFVPDNPNSLLLKAMFEYQMPHFCTDLLFNNICELPEDLRLYFLSVVYWSVNSDYCNVIHLHSLIICVVVLRTIDSKISPERNAISFRKRFGKIIAKEKAVRVKQIKNNITRCIKKSLESLPIPERMPFIPKSDCYLVQNDLVTHFHMQEIFKKKFDLYSSTVLHAYAEFQAVIFHMYGLNALLNYPYMQPHMGHLYCGVFLYNMYDILKNRDDMMYYVKHNIFRESQMMYDFYQYLCQWCHVFISRTQKTNLKNVKINIS